MEAGTRDSRGRLVPAAPMLSPRSTELFLAMQQQQQEAQQQHAAAAAANAQQQQQGSSHQQSLDDSLAPLLDPADPGSSPKTVKEQQLRYMHAKHEDALMERLVKRMGTTSTLVDHRPFELLSLLRGQPDRNTPTRSDQPSSAAAAASADGRAGGAADRRTPTQGVATSSAWADGGGPSSASPRGSDGRDSRRRRTADNMPLLSPPPPMTPLPPAAAAAAARSDYLEWNQWAGTTSDVDLVKRTSSTDSSAPLMQLTHVNVGSFNRGGTATAAAGREGTAGRAQGVADAHALSINDPLAAENSRGKLSSTGSGLEPEHSKDNLNTDDRAVTAEELAVMSWPRRAACRICDSPDFELAVVVLILANTVVLCLFNPMQPETSPYNSVLSNLEIALNVLFTLEMLVRIVAAGSVTVYLSKPWNVFDTLMVLAGYTMFIPVGDTSNTSAIRALRALRALRVLRLIARFESLRGVVACFFEAIPMLLSVVYLLLFIVFIYAVAGTQLFMNVYHNTCEDPSGMQCGSPYCLLDQGDDPDMFGCGGYGTCPANYECVVTDQSTAINTANFDNVLLAMVVMFQCMTLSGWDFIMYRVMDGSSPFAFIYFFTFISIMEYFVIHLFLAVLKAKFAKAQRIFHARSQLRGNKNKKNSISNFFSNISSHLSNAASQRSATSIVNSSRFSTGGGGFSVSDRHTAQYPGSIPIHGSSIKGRSSMSLQDSRRGVTEGCERASLSAPFTLAGTAGHPSETTWVAQNNWQSARPSVAAAASGGTTVGTLRQAVAEATEGDGIHHAFEASASAHAGGGGSSAFAGETSVPSRGFPRREMSRKKTCAFADEVDDALPLAVVAESPRPMNRRVSLNIAREGSAGHDAATGGAPQSPEVEGGSVGTSYSHSQRTQGSPRATYTVMPFALSSPNPAAVPMRSALKRSPSLGGTSLIAPAGLSNHHVAMMVMSAEEFDDYVEDRPFFVRHGMRLQYRLRALVTHRLFSLFFLFVIVVNTLLLSLDYNGASTDFGLVLTQANYVLTALFTVEVSLKLAGLGFWDFVSDWWNWFDCFVVVTSVTEIIVANIGTETVAVLYVLVVLRALRVLRILKLFNYMSSLRKVFRILFASFTSFMAVLTLLALFWLVFAIIGLHVFGGLELVPYAFPNFNTLVNSLTSVFNTLALENMQNQMYSVVRATNYGSVMFYVTWVVIGKYVLLGLFLAVTLEAFEAKYDQKDVRDALGNDRNSMMSSIRSQASFSSIGSVVLESDMSAADKRGSARAAQRDADDDGDDDDDGRDSDERQLQRRCTDSAGSEEQSLSDCSKKALNNNGPKPVSEALEEPNPLLRSSSPGLGRPHKAPRRGPGAVAEALEDGLKAIPNEATSPVASAPAAPATLALDRAARRAVTPQPRLPAAATSAEAAAAPPPPSGGSVAQPRPATSTSSTAPPADGEAVDAAKAAIAGRRAPPAGGAAAAVAASGSFVSGGQLPPALVRRASNTLAAPMQEATTSGATGRSPPASPSRRTRPTLKPQLDMSEPVSRGLMSRELTSRGGAGQDPYRGGSSSVVGYQDQFPKLAEPAAVRRAATGGFGDGSSASKRRRSLERIADEMARSRPVDQAVESDMLLHARPGETGGTGGTAGQHPWWEGASDATGFTTSSSGSGAIIGSGSALMLKTSASMRRASSRLIAPAPLPASFANPAPAAPVSSDLAATGGADTALLLATLSPLEGGPTVPSPAALSPINSTTMLPAQPPPRSSGASATAASPDTAARPSSPASPKPDSTALAIRSLSTASPSVGSMSRTASHRETAANGVSSSGRLSPDPSRASSRSPVISPGLMELEFIEEPSSGGRYPGSGASTSSAIAQGGSRSSGGGGGGGGSSDARGSASLALGNKSNTWQRSPSRFATRVEPAPAPALVYSNAAFDANSGPASGIRRHASSNFGAPIVPPLSFISLRGNTGGVSPRIPDPTAPPLAVEETSAMDLEELFTHSYMVPPTVPTHQRDDSQLNLLDPTADGVGLWRVGSEDVNDASQAAAVGKMRWSAVSMASQDGAVRGLFGLPKYNTQQSAELHSAIATLSQSPAHFMPLVAEESGDRSSFPGRGGDPPSSSPGRAGRIGSISSRPQSPSSVVTANGVISPRSRMSLGGLSIGSTSTTGHTMARQANASPRIKQDSAMRINGVGSPPPSGQHPQHFTTGGDGMFGDTILAHDQPSSTLKEKGGRPATSPRRDSGWVTGAQHHHDHGADSIRSDEQRADSEAEVKLLPGSADATATLADGTDVATGMAVPPPPPPARPADKHGIPMAGKSFFMFGTSSKLRRRAYNLVHRRWFENAMFMLILANCVTMALEHPRVQQGSVMANVILWSNIGFTACFTLEAIIKVFAWTFNLYIRKLANQVDFAIVVISVLAIVLEALADGQAWIHTLRILQVFKPLRLLTHSRSMQLVLKSLTMSLAAMAHVSLVLFIFFLIFAILGTQLFMGRLYTCNDVTVARKSECVDTYIDAWGRAQNRLWENQFPNFDNVGNALLVCFITATLNGYTNTMQATMSSPMELDIQPADGRNPLAFLWYLGFGVIVSFTLINLYVGVIFSQFSKIRLASQTGSAFLTSQQQEWAELSRMVFRLKPADKSNIPTQRHRRVLYDIISHRAFDYFIMVVVCLNIVTMAMIWWQQSEEFLDGLDLANATFTGVYIIEASMKITALGWPAYWRNGWNKFDFVLVVIGLIDIVMTYIHTSNNAFLNIQKLLRLARIARMIKLMKSASGIKHMIQTLIAALPAFANVGALLALFFFMFAYVGVWLLGEVVHIRSINRWANFDNFLFATMTLFRIATGDNWSDVLFDSLPNYGLQGGPENNGTWGAIPYFLSFYIVIPLIMLNLFTAVIIETFDKENEQDAWKLSPQALEDFVALWAEYDDGTATISTASLEALLLRLDPPLGLGPFAVSKDVLRFVYDLDIPLVRGRVSFHKTAFELVKRCSMANIPEGMLKQQIDELVERFFHDLHHDETMNFSVAVVVQKIQRKWRTRMRAARLKRRSEWRDSRVAVPSYSQIWTQRDAASDRFKLLKRVQESGVVSSGSTLSGPAGPPIAAAGSRWRFNPSYSLLLGVQQDNPDGQSLRAKTRWHKSGQSIFDRLFS